MKDRETKEKRQGRPTKYTKKICDDICDRLMVGESLSSICRDNDMPESSTVYRWLMNEKNKEFCDMYARARVIAQESYLDKIIDLCEETTIEDVPLSKFKVDSLKWVMSKLAPRKYGSKTPTLAEDGESEEKEDLSYSGLYET